MRSLPEINNKHRNQLFSEPKYPRNEFRWHQQWKARRPDHWRTLSRLKRATFKFLTE